MTDGKSSEGGGPDNRSNEHAVGKISTTAELRAFLEGLRDKMADDGAPAIYALSAMNHVLTLPTVYSLLDNETKEIARDIWLRIKQSGFQVRNPVLLFGEEEAQATP